MKPQNHMSSKTRSRTSGEREMKSIHTSILLKAILGLVLIISFSSMVLNQPAEVQAAANKEAVPACKNGLYGYCDEAAKQREAETSLRRGEMSAQTLDDRSIYIVKTDPSTLPEGAHARIGLGVVRAISFSSDGRFLAVGSGIGVYLYLSDTFEERWMHLTEKPVEGVAFSPDGAWVAYYIGQEATILDVEKGRVVQVVKEDLYQISGVAIDPSGRMLATASGENVKVWDIATGELAKSKAFNEKLYEVLWSPSSEAILIASSQAFIWHLDTDEILELAKEDQNSILQLAWSADGNLIAAGLSNGSVQVWDMDENLSHHFTEGHDLWVSSIVISQDSTLLATGGERGEIALWDLRTGQQLYKLAGHQSEVVSLAFTPGMKTLISGGKDHQIIEWALDEKMILRVFDDHTDAINCISWSPDGSLLAAGLMNGNVQLWDVRSGERSIRLEAYNEPVMQLVWSPNGRMLVSLADKSNALVWDVVSGRLLKHLDPTTQVEGEPVFWPDGSKVTTEVDQTTLSVAFSPDSSQLVTGNKDARVIIWDIASGEPVHMLEGHTLPVDSVDFLSDGNQVVSMSLDGTVIYWDVVTGEKLDQSFYPGHSVLVVSPDETIFAFGRWEGGLVLWDARNDERTYTLSNSFDVLVGAQFNPDGSLLASGMMGDFTAVTVWDVRNGNLAGEIVGHTNDVRDVVFSPDGKNLASASWDGTILFWEVEL